MLGNLKPQAEDKILKLMAELRADPREGKIDLGVGVYKDATGLTPVMRAVKAAEKTVVGGGDDQDLCRSGWRSCVQHRDGLADPWRHGSRGPDRRCGDAGGHRARCARRWS